MAGSQVVLLGRITLEVVEFKRRFCAQAIAFPVAEAHRLLEVGFIDLEVERFVLCHLFLAQQGRQNGDAIRAGRHGNSGQLGRRGQKIHGRSQQVAGGIGWDFSWPAGDERRADATFVKHSLGPPQPAGAGQRLNEFFIRPVVGGEDHQRIVVDAEVFDLLQEAADVFVDQTDHRGVIPDCLRPRLLGILGIVRDDIVAVWRRPRSVAEKRTVLVLLDELQRLIGDVGVRIILPCLPTRLGQGLVDTIADEIIGVKIVRMFLVVVAEEQIKALLFRRARRAGIAETPFSETTSRVTGFLQQAGDGHLTFGEGEQPVFALVRAAQDVPRVLAGHQHAARWRTDGAPAVGTGKLHALRSHPINIGSDTILAAISREIPDSRVIDEDKNNVGLYRRRISDRGGRCWCINDETEKEGKYSNEFHNVFSTSMRWKMVSSPDS